MGRDQSKCFGMLLDGRAQATGIKQRGHDATMLLILNSHHDVVNFTLPGEDGERWFCLIDSKSPGRPRRPPSRTATAIRSQAVHCSSSSWVSRIANRARHVRELGRFSILRSAQWHPRWCDARPRIKRVGRGRCSKIASSDRFRGARPGYARPPAWPNRPKARGRRSAQLPDRAALVRCQKLGVPRVGIANSISLVADDDAVILILDVTPERQPPRKYLLPVSILWDAEAPASAILAEVRYGSSRGVLVDAFADDQFIPQAARRIGADDGTGQGEIPGLIFRRSALFDGLEREMAATSDIERRAGEQSNTSIKIGGTMLKGCRRLEPGVHPELEIGRFLTEVAGFRNAPALLGSVELVGRGGEVPTALCVLQALIPNQGDGWAYVIEHLKSIRNEHSAGGRTEQQLCWLAHCLGQRTAELHHAFALGTDDIAFAPEPVQPDHLSDWAQAIRSSAASIFEALNQARPRLDGASQQAADRLLGPRRFADADRRVDAGKSRRKTNARHGDTIWGQVLIASDDVFIIDFEGEPMRPLTERRDKHLPLRDVSGMLRSFQYAAAPSRVPSRG